MLFITGKLEPKEKMRMCAIKVGFGRAEITPKKSVPLTGYGNEAHRHSQNVLDSLYTTCSNEYRS